MNAAENAAELRSAICEKYGFGIYYENRVIAEWEGEDGGYEAAAIQIRISDHSMNARNNGGRSVLSIVVTEDENPVGRNAYLQYNAECHIWPAMSWQEIDAAIEKAYAFISKIEIAEVVKMMELNDINLPLTAVAETAAAVQLLN